MLAKLFVVFAGAILAADYAIAATDKVVCYHGTWSRYRPGLGQYTVDDIDPALCTHLVYAFVGLGESGEVRLLDEWLDIGLGGFRTFTSYSSKALLAIGGWNEGSEKYSRVAASPALRSAFVASARDTVLSYGFDGFDLDWEYPAQRGGGSYDKENFALLLAEFRAEFDKHGLLLSAAVAAAPASVDQSYDVPALSKYLDYINVMTYDLHGSWDGVTGLNAPLYASSLDVTDAQKALNVEACIQGWIERGADPQKLVLGMGTYGRSFTLSSASDTGIGALAPNGGTAGPYTRETGMLGYNEICVNVQNGWTEVYDEQQQAPYAYNGNQWVGYDNPRSIKLKVEFAKSLNLGGVMIWSVETDDFQGACGVKYPLLNAIHEALYGSAPPAATSTTAAPPTGSSTTTSTTSAPTASTAAPSAQCPANGYFRNPNDCTRFYYCLDNAGSFNVYTYDCPAGLFFDELLVACNYADEVDC